MQELKKLETKFRKMGFTAEIDFNNRVLCVQCGDLTKTQLSKTIDGLKKPKFSVKWDIDICGDVIVIITHRRFLNGWW